MGEDIRLGPAGKVEQRARGEEIEARLGDRGAAFAMLLDRYRKAGNFNRPWMLAVSYHGGALDGPPQGDARRWWENAYPRAYNDLVEKHRLGARAPEKLPYTRSGLLGVSGVSSDMRSLLASPNPNAAEAGRLF
jgi:hypothetical protein